MMVMGFTCLALSGCSHSADSTAPSGAMTADVYTAADAFSPPFITIGLGGTVTFHIAGDPDGHDVTFRAVAGAPANIPVTVTGTISRTFNTAGTFPYDCRVHPGMTGTITVQQ
jgi:plastocyanin